MNTGIVQNFLAFRNTQETSTLLESFGSQLGDFFQLGSAGKGTVFLTIGNNILCSSGIQTGDLLQQTSGSGVGIYANCIDTVFYNGT